jgi:hypothetical protein
MNILEYAIARKLAGGGSGGSSGDNTGGGGSVVGVSPKAVNFRDYDGTVLHSYTKDEALALTELPKLPTQPGLICQEWNWSLEDMQSYVADYGICEVGATYITDDGKTRLYITIAAEGRMDVPLYLYFPHTVANGLTIDWGDGSATETISPAGNINPTHTYESIGDYVITLEVAEGCTFTLGRASSSCCVMGSTENNGMVYCNMLQKVEVGNGVTTLGTYAFNYCYSLASVVIPNSVTDLGDYAFNYCYSLASVVIPNSVTNITGYAFNYCYSLASAVIPNSVKRLGNYAFCSCYTLASVVIPNRVTSIGSYAFKSDPSLASVVIPNSVTSIGTYAFIGCKSMAFYDFTSHTAVPTLSSSNAISGIPSDCEIRVPAALAEEWKAATNWSTYASQIVGV